MNPEPHVMPSCDAINKATLTHTPNPMRFLNEMLGRPVSEKPIMIVAVGHPAEDAKVPKVTNMKKPLDEILAIAE